METLRLSIGKRAAKKLESQVSWYNGQFMYSFAKTLLENFSRDVDRLCATPTIGRRTDIPSRHEIRVFISNKKCLIKYWYDSSTLHVVDIVFTDTHSPRFFRQ